MFLKYMNLISNKLLLVCAMFSTFFFVACSSGDKQESENTEISASSQSKGVDWNDSKVRKAVALTISNHYVDNSFKKGRLDFPYLDRVSNQQLFLAMQKIEEDSIFPLSKERAFVKVITKNTQQDSALVEMHYEVINKYDKIKFDSSYYEIVSISLRKVGKQERYVLRKEGDFWTKEILAVAQ